MPRSLTFLILAALTAAGCGAGAAGERAVAADAAAVPIAATPVVEEAIARFIEVTGSLTAEESADVAAEIAGRIVATPVERGSRVGSGGELVRIAATEVDAQAREAAANAAQIEARLGIAGGAPFEVARVPEVAGAHAARLLARTDFERARTLHASQLMSQAEFDQRSAQLENAERQYDVAVNGAEQQYQSLLGARARVTVAQKAVADTVVRAPFAGVVGERFVSTGDFVTRGTRVASVMRVDPLRVELTVPAQYISAVAAGGDVTFQVDAYPGQVFTGQVRYVSPSVTAETRALVVEAIGAERRGAPEARASSPRRGSRRRRRRPACWCPPPPCARWPGTARVFVVSGDRVEERVVMVGQTVGPRIEITSGLTAGEQVATSGVESLADGVRVAVR